MRGLCFFTYCCCLCKRSEMETIKSIWLFLLHWSMQKQFCKPWWLMSLYIWMMQRSLGFSDLCRRFICNYNSVTAPLSDHQSPVLPSMVFQGWPDLHRSSHPDFSWSCPPVCVPAFWCGGRNTPVSAPWHFNPGHKWLCWYTYLTYEWGWFLVTTTGWLNTCEATFSLL